MNILFQSHTYPLSDYSTSNDKHKPLLSNAEAMPFCRSDTTGSVALLNDVLQQMFRFARKHNQ